MDWFLRKREVPHVEIFDGSEDPQSSADSEKLNSCLITEFLTCIVYRRVLSNLKWESLKHLNFLDLADRSGSLLFLPCGRGHRRDLEYQWPGQSPTTSPGSQECLGSYRYTLEIFNPFEGVMGILFVCVFVQFLFCLYVSNLNIVIYVYIYIVEVLLKGFLKFNPLTWNPWAQDPHIHNRTTLRRFCVADFVHRVYR